MALLDFLTGSPGKSSQFIAPQQEGFLKDLWARAQQASQTQPGMGTQTTGQQMGLDAVSGMQPGIEGAQQAGQFLTNPNILSPDSNPYLQAQGQAAVSPIFQNLMNTILPGIRNNAGMAGQMGSSRQGIAEGLGIQGAMNTGGNILSDLFSRAYGQGLGAMGQGLSLAPQTAALGQMTSEIYRQIGAEQQAMPFSQLNQYANLLGSPITLGNQKASTPGLASQVGLNFAMGG